jgi:hypothetical protein
VTALSDFLARLSASLDDDSFVRLSLTSPSEAAEPVQKALAKLTEVKGARCLAFTLREERRDTHENLPIRDAIERVRSLLGASFGSAMLATTSADWQLQDAGESSAKLIRHKPSTVVAPKRAHDDEKPTFLGENAR